MNMMMQHEGRGDSSDHRRAAALKRVQKLAEEDAVVLFSKSGCAMCVAAKALLSSVGAHPTIHQLDKQLTLLPAPCGEEMEAALLTLLPAPPSVPAVFIGGKLLGGMEQLIAYHIRGSLLPLLIEAGAL